MTRFLAVLILLAFALDAQSQMVPRRDRMGSPRENQTKDREAQRPSAMAQDPIAALERELPSLKVDLMLTADQVSAWNAFDRAVRDAAELERSRRRHLMALRSEGEKPATALTFVASLAEDERQKSEATTDVLKLIESLYDKFDARQRALLDRRVIQSQTEPLGR